MDSPIFVLNSIYDDLILALIVTLDCLPPDCDDEGMKIFDDYGEVRHMR